MEIVFSTPYRENSIINIAQAASKEGKLRNLFTTIHTARLAQKLEKLPFLGLRIAKDFRRRSFPDIPPRKVVSMASGIELLHVISRRLFANNYPYISSDMMYRVKSHFDKKVSIQLSKKPAEAFLGMYGASIESFKAIKRSGGITILNFVNDHPIEHNRILGELAGLKMPHHELIPEWIIKRVDKEIELADFILVPSQLVAKQLISHGKDFEKILIIPYGVDLQTFHPLEQKKENKTLLECLYVGQISHRKGVRILIEAAKQCMHLPVYFRLIGPLVSKNVIEGLPKNMQYVGAALPGGGVAEAMRNSDFFVLPTLQDAFALVVFEAMATGLPVITTEQAGSSECIENGIDGIIVPAGNPDSLAEAISYLAEKPHLRIQIGQAARKKIQEHYSWTSYGKKVLSAISYSDSYHSN